MTTDQRPVRVLFATTPTVDAVEPALPIAAALIERGHQAHWYTGREHRSAIESIGADFEPMFAAIDPLECSIDARFPERANLSGFARFKFDIEHLALDEVPGQIDDLRRILRSFPADVLLADTGMLAAPILRELGGPRWVSFGCSPLVVSSRDTAPFGTGLAPGDSPWTRWRNRMLTSMSDTVMFRDVNLHRQRVRAHLGLAMDDQGVLESSVSPRLHLQGSTASFEYPRSDLSDRVRFVGPLLARREASTALPAWWGELRGGRPVIVIDGSDGPTGTHDLARAAFSAMANDDVMVVAVGSTTPPAELPGNGFTSSSVTLDDVMPHATVVVTRGRFATVQRALASGVPLVIADADDDPSGIAAHLAWLGAGVTAGNRPPSPERIRAAVRTVLTDRRIRNGAGRIRDEIARHDGGTEAAVLVEALALGRSTSDGFARRPALARA